jgi:hypothetical protein
MAVVWERSDGGKTSKGHVCLVCGKKTIEESLRCCEEWIWWVLGFFDDYNKNVVMMEGKREVWKSQKNWKAEQGLGHELGRKPKQRTMGRWGLTDTE